MIEEKQKQHKIILILIYFNLFFLLLNRLHNRSNIRIVGQLTIWMPFWHCCRNRSGIMFQHLEHACIFHIFIKMKKKKDMKWKTMWGNMITLRKHFIYWVCKCARISFCVIQTQSNTSPRRSLCFLYYYPNTCPDKHTENAIMKNRKILVSSAFCNITTHA